MKYFYNGGFYDPKIHAIPDGAVQLTDDEWAALLDGQAAGKRIVAGADGKPVLDDPAAPARDTLLDTLRQRIDAATDQAILTGFEYQGTGFKLSLENQMNFKTECELRDSLTYPHRIKAIGGYYDLATAEEYRLFYLAGIAFIRTKIEAGWTRKDALDSLTDAELLTKWKGTGNE